MKISVLEKDETMQNTACAIPADDAGNLNEKTYFTIEMPAKTAEKTGGISKRYAYRFIKRAFDIAASMFGLIILSPLLLIVAVAIKLDGKGNIIYSSTRMGENRVPFKFYKFRSMKHNAHELFHQFTPEQKAEFEKNFKLENDPRITKLGNFLRKTSLDELPQLWNIFKGDLSIVGPRPIIEREVYKYGGNADKFFSVKPGLTGYWQINGRSSTSYEERVEMDMHYIDNRSLYLDAKIFIKTFAVVFKKTGAH